MAAEWGKNFKIVRHLIDKGADVNAKAKNGDTALKLAKTKGHARIVELLKAQGANE
ncbi:MAG: ankyrin repeat domain-containing protein [Desulfomonilaceae bacterium]